MKLEAVGRVSMRDMGLEVGRQIDDIDGSKGAFLRADTATNAQTLGDESNLRFGSDFDAETTTSNNGARLFTFLSAFLRFALVCTDDGDTSKLVGHVGYGVLRELQIWSVGSRSLEPLAEVCTVVTQPAR
jgi:hypothetical protein